MVDPILPTQSLSVIDESTSPDPWWTGHRMVDGEDVYDDLTIRDENGLVVRVCATAQEAADLIAANNASEQARVASMP